MSEFLRWLFDNISNPFMPYLFVGLIFFVSLGLMFGRKWWSDLRKEGWW